MIRSFRLCTNRNTLSAVSTAARTFSSEREKSVGFIGLGAMGYHMAGHLTKAPGTTVYVYNRTHYVAERHAKEHNTIPLDSVRDIAEKASVVFTCLPISETVREVCKEMVPPGGKLRSDFILVDCTSGDYQITQEIGRLVEESGGAMVDMPVSGGPAGAKSGQLSVMAGGANEPLSTVTPLASLFAKAVTHVGPLGAGHAVKSINNVLNTTHLIAAAEGVSALQTLGICPKVALNAINQSSGRSLQTEVRVPVEVLTGAYKYGFKLGLMQKDVSIASPMLHETSTILLQTQHRLKRAVEKYGEDADYTEVVKIVEDDADKLIRPLWENECTKKNNGQ